MAVGSRQSAVVRILKPQIVWGFFVFDTVCSAMPVILILSLNLDNSFFSFMIRYLQVFVLIAGSSLIQCISFGQDGIHKEYFVKFSNYKTWLSRQASAMVDSIASAMKTQPNWNYAIGCCVVCNGRKNAVVWERVNAIVNRLVTKYRIAAERFVFFNDNYPENCDEIRLRYTEERISTEAPPHPSLRRKVTEPICPPDTSSSYNY